MTEYFKNALAFLFFLTTVFVHTKEGLFQFVFKYGLVQTWSRVYSMVYDGSRLDNAGLMGKKIK